MCEEDEKIIHRLKYYNDETHLAKRIVELQHCIEDLRNQLQQKDNIIKEVRGIAKHEKEELDKFKGVDLVINTYQQVFGIILEILDKGNK